MADELWKMPPREKIPEAYSAIADGRVELGDNKAVVYSSDRAKRYRVEWRDGIYTSDDNGSRWQKYTGYPLLAVWMKQGILPLDTQVAAAFAGINWTELNQKYKRDYAAALNEVLENIVAAGGDAGRINLVIDETFAALQALGAVRKRGVETAKKSAELTKIEPPSNITHCRNSADLAEFTAGRSDFAIWCAPDFSRWELYDGKDDVLIYDNTENGDDMLPYLWRLGGSLSGHNIKGMLRLAPEAYKLFVFDTALAAYLDDAAHGEMTLEDAVEHYLQCDCRADLPGVRSRALWLLAERLRHMSRELAALYRDIELPLCRVLADMERRGVRVDAAALRSFAAELENRLTDLSRLIFADAGEEFNINSPKQLAALLFDKLQLPSGRKNSGGNSTDIDVLTKLRTKHQIIDKIIEFRQLSKLKSTYADSLAAKADADGRIHSQFNMMATLTGRLSSSEPNLQNIPVRSTLGGELRKMFIPAPGCVFIDADYSQIELRILSHISGDEAMIAAFNANADIHSVTASQVFHVPPEEVTDEMRRRAKAVNFGIVYGISAFALAEDIGVSRSEAADYIAGYLAEYGGVKKYMAEVVAQAKKDKFVTTLTGRRRFLPELESASFNVRSFGERAALNTPIQGSAADIISLAMIGIEKRLRDESLPGGIVLQVHDELLLEVPVAASERVREIVVNEMENAMKLRVPLAVSVGVGRSWFSAKG